MIRRKPSLIERRSNPRLIYFLDGVRVPKKTAVRRLMLGLILSHAIDWNYRVAENELERSTLRSPTEAFQEKLWREEQWPKPRKRA